MQVAIEVEREEDGGGSVGETFTDYVSLYTYLIMFIYLFFQGWIRENILHIWLRQCLDRVFVNGQCAWECKYFMEFGPRVWILNKESYP